MELLRRALWEPKKAGQTDWKKMIGKDESVTDSVCLQQELQVRAYFETNPSML